MVLVKRWLLAIPHYIVVSIFQDNLLIVLVLIAGVVNLFTGKYPKDIWEFVMGINRWTFRATGYAVLVTDQYPPFRLGE